MTDQPSDPWLIAEAESDGQPLIFRIREAIPPDVATTDYPHLLNIVWPYDSDESGMPADDVDGLQNAFEDRLDLLEKRGLVWLMVVITGSSEKEWLCYVGDVEQFMQELNEAVTALPTLPLDIEVAEDAEWNTYAEFVADLPGE